MTDYCKKNKTAAFTLVELIIAVLMIGIFTAIAVPRMKFSAIFRKKADTTAMRIVTDLRRTRSLAIANAATNSEGFKLMFLTVPPYTSYRIINIGTSEVIDSQTIDLGMNIICSGDRQFKFGPLGNLRFDSPTGLTVEADGYTFLIEIIPATGMIEWSEN